MYNEPRLTRLKSLSTVLEERWLNSLGAGIDGAKKDTFDMKRNGAGESIQGARHPRGWCWFLKPASVRLRRTTMMFSSRQILASFAVVAALCATANANLLLNPGAETGAVAPEWGVSSLPGAPASGQSIFSIIDAVGSHGLVSPASGSFFFSLAEADSARADSAPLSGDGDGIGDRLRLVQQGNLPAGASLLTLTGLFQTIGPDTAEVILTVINAANDDTFSVFSSAMTSAATWTAYQLQIDLEALSFEAALWRVQLRGRFNGSTDFASSDLTTDVFFDDLQLIATPEASTMAIWCTLLMCAGTCFYFRSRNPTLSYSPSA